MNPSDVLTKPMRVDAIRHFMKRRGDILAQQDSSADEELTAKAQEWVTTLPCVHGDGNNACDGLGFVLHDDTNVVDDPIALVHTLYASVHVPLPATTKSSRWSRWFRWGRS